MRFFKAKKKNTKLAAKQGDEAVKADDTLLEMKSELDSAVVPELADVKQEAAEDAPVEAAAEDQPAAEEAPAAEVSQAAAGEQPAVRLFPGFENEPFEIGYAGFKSADFGIEEETPMLLMRWKNGKGDWFPLPPVFNKAVLEQIHEEDSDLDRLLIGYGYDADQLVRKG